MGRNPNIYAAYKGDTFLNVGTIQQIAKFLGVSIDTAYYYATPTHLKKKGEGATIVFKLDDEDDEEVI